MSKKNKGKKGGFRETLSRLATTVKADATTVVLSPHGLGSTKHDPFPPYAPPGAPIGRLSRIASRINPFSKTPGASDKKTARKLKKLAQQMANGGGSEPPRPRVRRSRLPFVIAFLVALVAFGGYTAYDSISLPDIKIGKYLDYKKWLNLASGNVKPDAHKTRTSQSHVKHTPTMKKATKAGQGSKGKGRIVAKKGKASKLAKGKKTSAVKKKKWEKKLAKLKNQSSRKYKQASHKYRGKDRSR